MDEFVLPSAPNWFLSSITSGNAAGLFAFGARTHVYVYDMSPAANRGGTNGEKPTPGSSHEQLASEDHRENIHGNNLPRLIAIYSGHQEKIVSVCLSPDPDQLLCCSADDYAVNMWDILSRTVIQTHNAHKERITCMTWSPADPDLVLSGSEKGEVVLWRLKSNMVTFFQPQKDFISCIRASPHSSALVALGYRSGNILILNISHGQAYIVNRLRGIDTEITSICWCPLPRIILPEICDEECGPLLAASGVKLFKIWNTVTGKEIFFKRLPLNFSHKMNPHDAAGKRYWVDIEWPRSCPNYIISSSSGFVGDLLLWNLNNKSQQDAESFDCSKITKHTRIVFNITSVGDMLCSFSLDRSFVLWDLKTFQGTLSWSAFGGYVYSIKASPLDPGVVAIGSGDNSIRVWNQNNKTKPFNITCLSYGTRTIITSLAWHPDKEGMIAFGTEDGRVGMTNTLTVRPPVFSNIGHKRMVYVVCWGPPLLSDLARHKFLVYSVGDKSILQHFADEGANKKESESIWDSLCAQNDGQQLQSSIKVSDFVWKKDFTTFVIGLENGSVHVFNFPTLRLVCVLNIHQKIVNCLKWHPETTAESVHSSPFRNWIAFAGNDRHISVVDLPDFYADTVDPLQTPLILTQALVQLPAHLTKTTDMCWSPHHDGRLVSVGYDRTALVWNVKNAELLACFTGHTERVLAVQWSYLDPDIIISGGFDSTMRVWKISAQPVANLSCRKKKPKFKIVRGLQASSIQGQAGAGEVAREEGIQGEIQELTDLLEAKRLELLRQENPEKESSEVTSVESCEKITADDKSEKQGSTKGIEQVSNGQRDLKHYSYPPTEEEVRTPDSSSVRILDSASVNSSESTTVRMGVSQDPARSQVQVKEDKRPPLISVLPPQKGGRPADTESNPALDITLVPPVRDTAVVSPKGDDQLPEKILSVSDLVEPARILFPARKPLVGVWPLENEGVGKTFRGTQVVADKLDPLDRFKKRKLKPKTHFPNSSFACNRNRQHQNEDVFDLSRAVSGQGSAEVVDSKPHLGLYTDRLGAHRCLLQESEYHLNNDNMEYHLQLELWRGNVAGALQIARQRNELSDWIVAMAPMASQELWQQVCLEYAEQLEEDGQYHKSATYLLAASKVQQAIQLFRRHKLYREAVSIAKIRLSSSDPLLEDLYTEWGLGLLKDGQYEQAAKCYLAMRQIQEAGKTLAKRTDPSSIRLACQLTLLSRDQHQGLDYGYKLFNQYLVSGDWLEARKFIAEHEALTVFLPVLSTHQLLIEHLSHLCPNVTLTKKAVSLEASTLEKPEPHKKNPVLPDFLLDKLETDPVIPWEPYLIEGHTFPHHVLRSWLQHQHITMVTSELKSLHALISQLSPHRQTLVDVPSIIALAGVDLTLCLLAFLTSDTSSAISHLLQAMSALHEAGQVNLLQSLCRLMLPQGPRYVLKLQQEFNATRVVVTMESQGSMDRAAGDGSSTIKKYLTDLKDDGAISTASPRCRELDFVRAYCYLTVLGHVCNHVAAARLSESQDGRPNGQLIPSSDNVNQSCSSTDDRLSLKTDEVMNVGQQDLAGCSSQVLSDLDQNGQLGHHSPSVSVNGETNHGAPASMVQGAGLSQMDAKNNISDNSFFSKHTVPVKLTSPSSLVSKSSPSALLQTSAQNASAHNLCKSKTTSAHDKPEANVATLLPSPTLQVKPRFLNSNMSKTEESAAKSSDKKTHEVPARKHLDYINLCRLSKGVLWDVQAKREALRATLGYIHHSISQHLLANRSANNSSQCELSSTATDPLPADPTHSNSTETVSCNDLEEEDGSCGRTRLVPTSGTQESQTAQEATTDSKAQTSSNDVPQSSQVLPNLETAATSVSPSQAPTQAKISPSGVARDLARTCSSQSPRQESSQQEQSGSDVTSLGPASLEPCGLQNPRKVLWVDGPGPSNDQNSSQSTFLISRLAPDGSTIPLEWDDLPVDVKYSQSYVSLALLRQEYEKISQELKRVADVSQYPFPGCLGSVKTLLQACLKSPDVSVSEKSTFIKQLNDWASVFAVTSHQLRELESIFGSANLLLPKEG